MAFGTRVFCDNVHILHDDNSGYNTNLSVDSSNALEDILPPLKDLHSFATPKASVVSNPNHVIE